MSTQEIGLAGTEEEILCRNDEEYQESEHDDVIPSDSVKHQIVRKCPIEEKELRSIFATKCSEAGITFSEKLFKRFLLHFYKNPNIKILSLESVGIGPRSVELVCQMFFRYPNYKVLNIASNNIQDEGALCVADLVYQCPDIVSLDISSNSIGDTGASAIFEALQTNQSVIHLHIGSNTGVGRNSIGTNAMQQLCAMLWKNKVLSELNLSMTEITSDSVTRMATALTMNKSLQYLNLSNNNIKSKGAIAVVRSIVSSNIMELYLGSNHIGDDVGPYFANFLETNERLVKLDLSGNSLGSKFTNAIVNSLSNQTVLRDLNLSRNPLKSKGITPIGTALAHNESIRYLDVSCCSVEIGGFDEFFQDLRKNKQMVKLSLHHNTLSDIGGVQLSHVLRSHPALEEVNCELCEISDEGCEAIMKALSESRSMERVSLKNNLIHNGLIIERMMNDNTKLQMLDIQFNDIDYKTFMDIDRMIKRNQKKREIRNREELARGWKRAQRDEAALTEIREKVLQQREIIKKLESFKEDALQKFEKANDMRAEHIGGLEANQKRITDEVDALMNEIRTQRSEMQMKVQQAEIEVNSLSTRLVREVESFKAECKSLANLDDRVLNTRAQVSCELDELKDRVDAARLKYNDAKEQFIAMWKQAQNDVLLKKIELEEVEKAETGGTTAKAKKSGKKSAKGGKGKSKKGTAKGKDGDLNTQRTDGSYRLTEPSDVVA